MKHDFEYRFRDPMKPPEALGAKPPQYRRVVDNGVLIEYDVPVRMRDGVKIYIDLFRPADERPGAVAPLIAWGPYGKHNPTSYARQFPGCLVETSKLSKYTCFEAPDPMYWVPKGYAVINVDPRGTWYSEGDATFVSPEEAQDEYDLIEWAGTQPWSNGKVGLHGVSYLCFSQYGVAALNPPHLAAINPWEGWHDFYREVVRHGGIPETEFWGYLPTRWGFSTTRIEDMKRETQEHPFFDSFWASKNADLSKIKVPAYVVASWTDQGLHTRGTLEAFGKISSPQKWLEVHGRKKWATYYAEESVRKQQAFFDHFLKGLPTEVTQWPKVRYEIREKYYTGEFRTDKAWPLPGTEYTKLYLNADGKLQRDPVASESTVRYAALGGGGEASRAQFDIKFDRRTDLVGHMKLRLWMSADGADDMDIFVAIQKLNAAGEIVPFVVLNLFDDGPVALGWMRASRRELDPGQSTEYKPVQSHCRDQKLNPGEIVPLDIEIWPSGTRFDAGETLRVVVQGTDIYVHPKGTVQDLHQDTVNREHHVIHAGGKYDSHLLVPVIRS